MGRTGQVSEQVVSSRGDARSLNATVTWMDLSCQLSVGPRQPSIPDFCSHLRLTVVREALGVHALIILQELVRISGLRA